MGGESQTGGTRVAFRSNARVVLTDFAYQLTVRAYGVDECKAPRRFPAQLRRYGNH
ncbi:hypothetical protein [Streptomyces sp. NPDC048720]|uniref:hypothetical protein n=1 Tax=Streptomyces sp. NPDC048720 TaxID=3365588 RepID=UPI0037210B3D